MVIILKYILLGILIYIIGIPVAEELATVIVQGLEVVKGWFVVIITKLQDSVKIEPETTTHVMGFTIPTDEYDSEPEEEDDNE